MTKLSFTLQYLVSLTLSDCVHHSSSLNLKFKSTKERKYTTTAHTHEKIKKKFNHKQESNHAVTA